MPVSLSRSERRGAPALSALQRCNDHCMKNFTFCLFSRLLTMTNMTDANRARAHAQKEARHDGEPGETGFLFHQLSHCSARG